MINTTTNILKIGLLVTATQFLLASGCNKNGTKPCVFGGYSFAVTSEWSPQREVYNIGDTIYLSSFFSKTLTDQINPSLVIDYSNSVGISGVIGLVLLDSINHQFIPATDSFQYIGIEGAFIESAINQNRTKGLTFVELQDKYRFTGGIVCRKKGIYEIDVDNLYSAGLRNTKCTSAGFVMQVTNANKHINLFESAIGQTPTVSRQKIMYCFRVQ